jgi:hypothetical protein
MVSFGFEEYGVLGYNDVLYFGGRYGLHLQGRRVNETRN